MNPAPRVDSPVSWVLRIGAAMEFLGHGMLGVGRVAAWTSYFAVVGIGKPTALALMPWVGALDVSLALVVLFYPIRSVILYMAAWGLWTALLRPLAGESAWEAVERAGNYGVLAALFLMAAGGGARSWFRFRLRALEGPLAAQVAWILRLTTGLLLAGHGALGLVIRKQLFAAQYGIIGLHAPGLEPAIGAAEIILAAAVLARPGVGLLYGVLAWKLASELLSPIAGAPMWVFIEHGGSYAAPLALAVMERGRQGAPDPGRRRAAAAG